MKSIYCLPYLGVEKIDEMNDLVLKVLSEIVEVKAFSLKNESELYPDNYKDSIPNLIFTPTFFDFRNPLSYDGVEFALRWYFHIISNESINNCEIVLLGTEDKAAFYQHCNYSNILKCPNIYYLQNSFEDISQFLLEYQSKENDRKGALERIEKIGIIPPTSFKTHHSIANEWSILRWASALGIMADNNLQIKKVKESVDSILYYNYLAAKYPIKGIDRGKSYKIQYKGKILFVDDELDKGWELIFREITSGMELESIDFCGAGNDFKGKSQNEIEKIIEKKISQFDPDVIVLDLRLTDDDFENEISEITGYRVLQKVKGYYDKGMKLFIPGINAGIQVIVLSATNKVWNLQALNEAGADGFIIKESPENSIDGNFTNQSIKNIYKTLDRSLEWSFLKSFYMQFNPIKDDLIARKDYKKCSNFLPKDFVDEVIKWIELSNQNLVANKNSFGITSSFLIYFSVIENITNRLIDVDNPILAETILGQKKYNYQFRITDQKLRNFVEDPERSGLYRKSKSKLTSSRNIPWAVKILNAFDFISEFHFEEDVVSNLIKKRHQIIHANVTTGDKININLNDLQSLYAFIIEGLKKIK